MALYLFGLTGGIGSGKSTVGRRFAARGVPVIDADQLAREVVAPGSEGLAEIVARFGPAVLSPAGELDRKALAARVFADDAERRALNALTHPRVGRRFAELREELERRGEALACYEVPLLFENRLEEAFRPVVVVAVPEPIQVERAAARDGADPAEIRARIRAQLPLAEKTARADHVIDNSGELGATLARADEVLDAICLSLGLDPARYPRPTR